MLKEGSILLFRAFGINVYLHWTWFVVLAWLLQQDSLFQSVGWHLAMYLALFGIVLLHEFGHALACRSVGGVAQRIVLWPLGGIAFVQPPPRPGAVLWSIVAGPLVNVVLVPITGLIFLVSLAYQAQLSADAQNFFAIMAFLNLSLLIFNLLPIYPLDGGRIVQAVLWFAVGRGRSTQIAAMIGLAGAAACLVAGLMLQQVMLSVIALFVGWQAYVGLREGRLLMQIEADAALQRAAQDTRLSHLYGQWEQLPEDAR